LKTHGALPLSGQKGSRCCGGGAHARGRGCMLAEGLGLAPDPAFRRVLLPPSAKLELARLGRAIASRCGAEYGGNGRNAHTQGGKLCVCNMC